ncbi:MAG TPA: hypothetical protein VJM74_04925 [Nitrososphaeraceae archaeon]|nr:hypothetical protein [Nitrososphaeraceae archaeon]
MSTEIRIGVNVQDIVTTDSNNETSYGKLQISEEISNLVSNFNENAKSREVFAMIGTELFNVPLNHIYTYGYSTGEHLLEKLQQVQRDRRQVP